LIGSEIDARNGDELVRFVRALGQHRYVSGRLHLVHAFALEAAAAADAGAPDSALAEAAAWAAEVLADPATDQASKDERLHRRATDAELVAVLAAFWSAGERRERAGRALVARLVAIGVTPPDPSKAPFDEAGEEDLFPVLIDAGWELLPLRALEPERHKGAINAFEDALAFDVAKFEEESAVPELVTLHELPALGATELLAALSDDGTVRAPFVLWTSGHATYTDYVLRGVLRAAKLDVER
jgi:hypothetical protein